MSANTKELVEAIGLLALMRREAIELGAHDNYRAFRLRFDDAAEKLERFMWGLHQDADLAEMPPDAPDAP